MLVKENRIISMKTDKGIKDCTCQNAMNESFIEIMFVFNKSIAVSIIESQICDTNNSYW